MNKYAKMEASFLGEGTHGVIGMRLRRHLISESHTNI